MVFAFLGFLHLAGLAMLRPRPLLEPAGADAASTLERLTYPTPKSSNENIACVRALEWREYFVRQLRHPRVGINS